jgi:heavy metal sensor kinase
MARSIRIRLAMWYFLVLAVGMALFSVLIFVALRYELMESLHESLGARTHSFALFLELESLGTDLPAIREEAREYSTGLPFGHSVEVRTADGAILFASSAGPNTGAELYKASEAVSVHGHELSVQMAAPLSDVQETLSLLRNILVLSIPLMLIGASAGGWWIAGRGLRPIDAMTTEAEAIGRADLSRRLNVPSTGDELQRLGLAWNRMLDRLDSSVQRMTRFTADAAHELRTPIAIIRTTSELALRRERDADSYRDSLTAIQQETVHLTRLVEDLMWLARHDAEALGPEIEDLAFEEIASDVCSAVAPLAEQRKIPLEVNIRCEGIVVRGDRLALRRLLLILLDNALKFNPSGESVSIAVTTQGARCRIEIHDRGPGIANEHREHIFERFYRGDAARAYSGFGLGLPIAKAIVEAHHGVIGVTSAGNPGSCFFVELPCAG